VPLALRRRGCLTGLSGGPHTPPPPPPQPPPFAVSRGACAVPVAASSLNSGDCFVLSLMNEYCIVWLGSGSSAEEQATASTVAAFVNPVVRCFCEPRGALLLAVPCRCSALRMGSWFALATCVGRGGAMCAPSGAGGVHGGRGGRGLLGCHRWQE
jgi:hypothetical protein